ncbi:flagellar biosynthetic protein FliP [Clostridium tetani]|uniref:flagellar type III secretion system pore protein FliP n=1 Tax=Clostridium tetani TaxID=1513 RepID=UPI000D2299ED|nr:flagellar type III secretion system pore protein FliP [Clostridium tetani]AVP54196.1 flagellar biosynthetic protein FliP [Clostridium tetani]RXI45941.1 flagellar biosynthetic protein FliP [Clostridium tetani]RXI76279.1 flagellar biosynthetic protein FliP [Clostridium tetani]RXM61333.1 flagellar biosynthetic protein FliP [Clostridium tetani]RXM70158.1 flagellar biosynthetic protein FliP [Clostridium tetani]
MENKSSSRRKISLVIGIVFLLTLLCFQQKALAAPGQIPIPRINISPGDGGDPKTYVDNLKLFLMITVLSILPSFIVMMTSFVRISVVFGFLRNAMGTQQSPPNQVLVGLALFLTIFIMTPVYQIINKEAIQPFVKSEINQEQAFETGSKPLREFMLKQTREKDLKLFVEISNIDKNITKENVPLYVVVPSFIISELKTAFQIGFLLYIPFLVIDLVVASVLMSMGMFMLPPVMVSLPFKLLLFVMVDGWHLLIKSLIMSFK